MTTRQKRLLLGGLLIGWAVLFGYRMANRPAGVERIALQPRPVPAMLTVRLDLLDGPKPEPPATTRNLFAPLIAPAPPAPPPPPPAPPPRPQPPAGPTPEEVERERVTKELGRYRYLGYLQKGSEAEGFLSTGDELLTVHAGEVVPPNGRYRVTGLTDETLRIHDPQTGVETALTLTGK